MGWPKGKARQAEVEDVPRETHLEEQKGLTVDEIKNAVKTASKEREFSDDKDHKGAFHPLCFGCKHREDMHHSWQSEQVLQDFRDQTGKVSQRLVTIKHKVYDAARPCQHACKCTEYR